jgi:hypothetical protein
LRRIVFTIKRTAHVVVASVAVELALDFGAGAAALALAAPFVGKWVMRSPARSSSGPFRF